MVSSYTPQQPPTINFPGNEVSPERLALSEAAGSGDIARVEKLLADLPSSVRLPQTRAQYITNARFAAMKKQLQEASRSGELDRLEAILENWKTEPSICNPDPGDFALALIEAARGGHARIVSKLLDEGALLDNTAPTTALKTGSEAVSMYQTFLEYGWDVNSFENLPVLQ
jgi:hypothetical protein